MLGFGPALLDALVAATPPPPRQGFTSVNALTALLSTESLLFAALNVALGLTSPVEGGRPLLIGPRKLAFAAFWLLAGVAAGAALAWCDLFLGDWPSDPLALVPIFCLLGGILAQPVFALVIALGIKKRTSELQPK